VGANPLAAMASRITTLIAKRDANILCIGLGNMGGPLTGQIARVYPRTSVFDLSKEVNVCVIPS